MTYQSSEEAMAAAEPVSFAVASRELRRHQVDHRPAARPGMIDVFLVQYGRDGEDLSQWETIPMDTRAILEHLGY